MDIILWNGGNKDLDKNEKNGFFVKDTESIQNPQNIVWFYQVYLHLLQIKNP